MKGLRRKPRIIGRAGRGALGLAALALAGGCASGGGGGTEPEPAAMYAARLGAVQALAATTDLPTRGSAAFSGATQLAIRDDSGAPRGEILGDLDIDIDFTTGRQAPVTGSAGAFRGRIDGAAVTWAGRLETGPARLASRIMRSERSVPLPGGGTRRETGGTMSANLTGDLATPGGTSEVVLSLGGRFVGPGAAGVHGPATANFTRPDGTAPYSGTGSFYLLRD